MISVTGCQKEDLITYDITGNWKVIAFKNYEASATITKTKDNTWSQFNNGDITVSFIEIDDTSGHISGRNVTNSFFGNYLTDKQGAFTVSDCFWTEINEPEWGRLFHSITKAETYELRNGKLIIFCNQRKISITLEKVD